MLVLRNIWLFCLMMTAQARAQTFSDMSEAYGIDCIYTQGGFLGGGAALEDINNDGLLDIVSATGGLDSVAVLINTGNGFAHDHGASGIAGIGENQQVLFGDYDNDGYRDLFLAIWGGPNYLYRNNGDGTFTDVTVMSGVEGGTMQSTCAIWLDYDRDGFLDLYVCNYGWDGMSDPPTPDEHNTLFRNNGNGTFSDVTEAAGAADSDYRRPLSALAFDFDYDLDADIVIAMDKEQRSTFLRNNGDGTFTDAGSGVGFEPHIDGMGLAIGDVDHNGWLDFTISNGPPGNELYMNNGNGTFSEESEARGARVFNESWGSHMFDCDLDGDDDIFVAATGDLIGNANDALLINDGTGHFVERAVESGIVENAMSFGAALGDINNDGALDIFVCNSGTPAALYQASTPTGNWVRLRLRGTVSNRDGVGSTIRVISGNLTQIRHTMAGSSFESSMDPRELIGIPGDVGPVVTVTWPSGIVDVFEELALNEDHLLIEGSGVGAVERDESALAREVTLSLYPNPFNSTTTIEFAVHGAGRELDISLYNELGQQVYSFPSQRYESGVNQVQWSGRDMAGYGVSSGVYVVQISNRGSAITRPLHFIK